MTSLGNNEENHMVVGNQDHGLDDVELTNDQIKDKFQTLIDSAVIDPDCFYAMFREAWHESELIGFMRSGTELDEYNKWVIEHHQQEFESFYGVKLTIEQVKGAL
jgi:hypothetical protein